MKYANDAEGHDNIAVVVREAVLTRELLGRIEMIRFT